MNPITHSQASSTPAKSLLSQASIHDDLEAQFAQALNKKQNFQSACTVKAFTPLLQVVAFEQSKGADQFALAQLARTLITHVRKQAMDVCVGLDIETNSLDWARSYFSTVIAEQLAAAWPERGQDALTINWSIGLCEIAQPIMTTKSIPATWNNTSQEVSIVATTVTAMQAIMGEYCRSNLFHTDKEAIQAEFTALLLTTASEMVDNINEHYPQTDDSRCSLAQSYIKNGGQVLARIWNTYAATSQKYFETQATPNQKEYFKKNGFPLTDMHTAFKQEMQSLETISLQAMAATHNAFNTAPATIKQQGMSDTSHDMSHQP